MKKIGFLHTAEVHVATFDQLLAEIAPGVTATHVVDEVLLADARQQGLTDGIHNRVLARMAEAESGGAGVVVCTCSTIGSVAEDAGWQRVDRALANAAVQAGENLLVVAVIASTLEPTRELITVSAENLQKPVNITMHHITGAWEHFERGDIDAYSQAIAAGIRAAVNSADYDAVVIAQASMAGAAALCGDIEIPVLSSPRLGVERAVAALG